MMYNRKNKNNGCGSDDGKIGSFIFEWEAVLRWEASFSPLILPPAVVLAVVVGPAVRLPPLPPTFLLAPTCCCRIVSFRKAGGVGKAAEWLYLFICSLSRRMFSCSSSSFCEGVVEKLDGSGELLADMRVHGSDGTYTRQLVLRLLLALFKQSLNFFAFSPPPPPPLTAAAAVFDFDVDESPLLSAATRCSPFGSAFLAESRRFVPSSSQYSSFGDSFTEMIFGLVAAEEAAKVAAPPPPAAACFMGLAVTACLWPPDELMLSEDRRR
uniref:Uncharacterized protein n=1 Tax=Anopheles merus TaxID=30066 RepID=A0A182VN36_ANOME